MMHTKLGPQLDELDSLFSRFDLPPSGQYAGWYQYFDRDIRSLLGMKVKSPFNNAYCGNGSLKRCQSAIWSALAAAGTDLTASQGTSDPSLWRSDATRERIGFSPGPDLDDDALHQPAERHPAGDLVQRAPVMRR